MWSPILQIVKDGFQCTYCERGIPLHRLYIHQCVIVRIKGYPLYRLSEWGSTVECQRSSASVHIGFH